MPQCDYEPEQYQVVHIKLILNHTQYSSALTMAMETVVLSHKDISGVNFFLPAKDKQQINLQS